MPRYVQSRRGGFKRPPRRILATLSCKECGKELVRGPTGWVCPASLRHGGIIGDALLLRRLTAALRKHYPHYVAARILLLRRRVRRWQERHVSAPIHGSSDKTPSFLQ